jgi:OOP family OmpA-OmpF porin
MSKKLLIALCLVGATSNAMAGEFNDDRFYVAPFGSYINTGGDRNAPDGWGAGMGIGKIVNEHINVELKGFWQNFGTYSRGGQWDLTGGSADLQYFYMRDAFSPYTVVGLGGMNTSTNNRSGAGFIGEVGAGFTYELLDNLLLRSDVRYRYNNNFDAQLQNHKDEYHDMVVNLGFVVPIGDKPQSTAIEPAAVPPAAKLECADRDTDHDGVNDCDDKCPGTLAGTKVDDLGCPIRIELRGVNFKYDSAELTDGAKAILDGVSESLIAFPQKKDIEVKGHTSSEGTNAYNRKLSQRRSASVVAYLKQKGVTNRLHAKGYGEDYPVADNSTETGRSKNRRVELVWLSE